MAKLKVIWMLVQREALPGIIDPVLKVLNIRLGKPVEILLVDVVFR